MDLFLTVDVGTSGVKVGIFNEEYRQVFLTVEEYALLTPKVDFVEVDAEQYYKALKNGLDKFSVSGKFSKKDIKAVCVSSQAETFVTLDDKNVPLMNAIVWLDNRATAESEMIKKHFGREHTFHITGQQDIVPTWTACKLLWLKRNKPELFQKIKKILFPEDYIIFKLTGKFFTDNSLLPSTLLFDIVKLKWWDEILRFVGISEEQLPGCLPSGKIIGNLTKEASNDLGISENAVVVTGSQDWAVGMIGSGNIKPGIVSETTGTSLAICTTIKKPVFDKKMQIPCYIHSIENKYVLLPWSHNSGIILRWFRDKFFNVIREKDDTSGPVSFTLLDDMAKDIKPGSDGIIILPFFSGAGSPELDPNARGVIFGLSFSHERKHMVRAIMESIAYVLKSNIQSLEEIGIGVSEVISLGGGAKSDLWCQIKADVLNKKIIKLENEEVSSLGLAILAGLAIKKFNSLESAIKENVRVKEVFFPVRENMELYMDAYKKYKNIYNTLKPVF